MIGPGSLYTSILPSLLLPEVRAASAAATAPRVLVCNVATQVGETEGYTLADHLAALTAHGVGDLLDIVLANDESAAHAPVGYPAAPVRLTPAMQGQGPRLVTADVVNERNAHHHDPAKLASTLIQVSEERASTHLPASLPRAAQAG